MEQKNCRVALIVLSQGSPYQQEQAAAAKQVFASAGLPEPDVFFNDQSVIGESSLLLELVRREPDARPGVIVIQPTTSVMPSALKQVAAAGIGIVVLNRAADWLGELQRGVALPVCARVGINQHAVGCMQATAMVRVQPKGGFILHIRGPRDAETTEQRTAGFLSLVPKGYAIRERYAPRWAESEGYRLVRDHLQKSSNRIPDVIVAQSDDLAVGALRALKELGRNIPVVGADGAQVGRDLVKQGRIRATVEAPNAARAAFEMLTHFLKGALREVPSSTVLEPKLLMAA